MTVIVGVRKNGKVAIAADLGASQGDTCIPGEMRVYPRKIHRIRGSYIGIAGTTAHHSVMRSLLRSQPELFDLSDADTIFETFRRIHPLLKSEYFLATDENDDEQEYESNHMSGIIISSNGVFDFDSYREISAFTSFWAAGSGMEYALGALEALYNTDLGARALAEAGVEIACKFDSACGLPIESYERELATPAGNHRPGP